MFTINGSNFVQDHFISKNSKLFTVIELSVAVEIS